MIICVEIIFSGSRIENIADVGFNFDVLKDNISRCAMKYSVVWLYK